MKTLRITLGSILLLAAVTGTGCISNAKVVTAHGVFSARDVSDAALVQSLPGFENGYANVNGTRLHYVAGGKGQPLVLPAGLAGDLVVNSQGHAKAGRKLSCDCR